MDLTAPNSGYFGDEVNPLFQLTSIFLAKNTQFEPQKCRSDKKDVPGIYNSEKNPQAA